MAALLAKDDWWCANSADSPQTDFLPFSKTFLFGKIKYCVQDRRLPNYNALSFYVETPNFLSTDSSYRNEDILSMPEDVLIEVFRRLHPIDRIHSASLVCRQWYRLIYAKGLWTDVRVKPSEDEKINRCTKAFLEKISGSLKRLCVDEHGPIWKLSKLVTPVIDLLPSSAPELILLDWEAGTLCISDLISIDRRMPKLHTILLNRSLKRDFHFLKISDVFTFICTKRLFQNARRIVMSGGNFEPTIFNLQRFCRDRPTLLELQTSLGRDLNTESPDGNWSTFSLRRLRISDWPGEDFLQLVKNLTFLSITNGIVADLKPLRKLCHLEHLHLTFVNNTEEQYMALLMPSDENPTQFPHSLRYLSLYWCHNITDLVIQQIAISCGALRSLNVCDSGVEHKELFEETFEILATRLRDLSFLCLKGIHNGTELLGNLRDEQLPSLRFVSFSFPFSFQWMPFSKEALPLLNVLFSKRPDLIAYVDSCFISYEMRGEEKIFAMLPKDAQLRVIYRLQCEEGYCCTQPST